jgi:tetratricopeptide (TPR) repeat protein
MRKGKRPGSQPAAVPPAPVAVLPRQQGPAWWAWLCLLAGTIVAYAPALRGPFLFDDLTLPPMNEAARLPFSTQIWGMRPLYYMSLTWDYMLFGGDPFPYHLINLLYHVASGLLTFYIVRKCLALTGRTGSAAGWTAFLCAALFLLHPVQTEAVAYIASRSEAMSVFFALAAIAVFLRFSDNPIGWGPSALVLLLLLLGLAVKEHIAAAAAAPFLLDLFLRPGPRLHAVRRNWRLYIPLVLGGAAAVLQVYLRVRTSLSAGFGIQDVQWYQYLFTQFHVVWQYIRLFVLPVGQNLDWNYPFSRSFAELPVIAGFAGLAALLAAAWRFRSRYLLACLGLILFLVLLAPTSSIVPIADALAERRLYLPFIGLLLIVADFLSRVPPKPASAAASGAVLIACLLLTMNRAGLYTSPQAMWEDSVARNPRNARAHFHLAYAHYERGRCQEASTIYQRAFALTPRDYQLLIDWSLALDCANRTEEALQRAIEATQVEPRNFHGWATVGMMNAKLKRYDAALDALNRSIARRGDYDMARVYRGNVYVFMSRPAEAIQDFEFALRLNPNNAGARQGLAVARQQLAAKPPDK